MGLQNCLEGKIMNIICAKNLLTKFSKASMRAKNIVTPVATSQWLARQTVEQKSAVQIAASTSAEIRMWGS